MKMFGAVFLIAMLSGGFAAQAQVSAATHPAAGDAHPAKADPHPAAPAVAHPANPNYSPETNSSNTLGDVSTPQPFTTTSIDTTAAATAKTPETFVVPKFVDTQTNSVAVPATTSTPASTNQTATTTP